MRVSVSWLAEHVELPDGSGAAEVAEAFVRVGLEVEQIHTPPSVTGPLVIGQVAEFEMVSGTKKPIRYCQVDIGETTTRGIICGATNFTVGDVVVVALPGAVLPGGFEISARTTYDHVSDGMICSIRELGLGAEHAGILVLASAVDAEVTGLRPGADAREMLGLTDPVIELAVTPDRGYCFSIRGVARELACALDAHFVDPVARIAVPAADGPAWPVRIDDASGCRRFVARRVTGVDPVAPSPWWMRRRLLTAGIRPISLAVDVTNYVMVELGQPLHAYDTTTLTDAIVVRRAVAGEKLTTLDGTARELDPDDLLITDGSGPIGLAGVMGGAATEISERTDDVLLEAANFDPPVIARGARRHKLPSEASRRFERAVDPELCAVAAERAATLLVQYGGGQIATGRTDVGQPPVLPSVVLPLRLPDRIAGVRYANGVTERRLGQVGCVVQPRSAPDGSAELVVTPPSWRPDLVMPADLVEEVLRLEGLDKIPSTLPSAPAGRGLTPAQRRRRSVSRALAEAGYTEVLPFPFISPSVFDALGCVPDDVRRRTLRVVNPIDADRPELATTLLPGLLDAVVRNVARGMSDLAIYHIGQVVLPRIEQIPTPVVGGVDRRPADAEIAGLVAALPGQPLHVGVALTGMWEQPGWWGSGRAVCWADAVHAGHVVAAAAGIELRVVAANLPPWHPGRCACLRVGDWPVGYAGELHPTVIDALGLPARTCVMELDLDALPLTERRPAPVVSPFPPVLLDVALVVDERHPAAEVADTLREGTGPLLEHLRLFDVYHSDQLGHGKRSLAFTMRMRATGRTLTLPEATTARDNAIALATQRFGATVRG
ncbi:MAG: phenylalanine--tRNA ligase subunit beta [Pseudonocardia sp.]|nr:phenylalanine--tRNA ligase subunit beta [Pseudonocardia sp.]